MGTVRAANLAPVLVCACGHEHPNDQVLTAAQIIAARIQEAQQRESRQKQRTVKKDLGRRPGP